MHECLKQFRCESDKRRSQNAILGMDLDGIQAGLCITVMVDMEDTDTDTVDTVTDIVVTVVGTRDGKLKREDRLRCPRCSHNFTNIIHNIPLPFNFLH